LIPQSKRINQTGLNQTGFKTLNAPIKFGCRVFAVMRESSDIQSPFYQSLLKEGLVQNSNSMMNQSAPRKTHPVAALMQSATSAAETVRRALKGNGDGWGVVSYNDADQIVQHEVSLKAAHQDPAYQQSISKLIQSNPETALVHLLKNGAGRSPNANNLHPFVVGQWSGMLNGGVKGALMRAWKEIGGKYGSLAGAHPLGVTAGEAGLILFLGRLKERYGSVDTKQIGIENVKQVFAETVQELMVRSKGVFEIFENLLEEHPLPWDGKNLPQAAANFVFTDGDHLFAFRHGRTLYLGKAQDEQGRDVVMVTSEPTVPTGIASQVKWSEVPEDTVLSVTRDAVTGRLRISGLTIEKLVPVLPTLSALA
jgi:predicted glutamine amidotransferase